MITTIDTASWSRELSTGNAEFIETADQIIYVVSNVRSSGGGFGFGFGQNFGSPLQFAVFTSETVPPAPGPGAVFPAPVLSATYTFPQPTTSFDPAVSYDATTGLIHIIGTRDTPTGATTSNPQLNDLIKFTYDTNTAILTGPFVISASVGSRIRSSYDIAVLESGNTLVAVSLTDPLAPTPPIAVTSVEAAANLVTVNTATNTFVSGQWLLMDGLTNATFLNGQLLQVYIVTPNQFIAQFPSGGYPLTSDTGTATPVGSSLLAVELDAITNLPVPNTPTIIASSPSRTGLTFDGVSLIVNGLSVELYYQSHPKVFTFADQVFTINLAGRDLPSTTGFGYNFGNAFGITATGFGADFGFGFGVSTSSWTESPIVLTSFTARYSDNRLTVIADTQGNRWLSQTYWAQSNHPEGIIGSVLLGAKIGSQPWFFHPTFGTILGGSLVQSTLSVSANDTVNLAYLLQPFTTVADPPALHAAAWPLQIASVNPATLGLTNVPGFYNTINFTWLRGTKGQVDNDSLWAIVGEREILAVVAGELHTIGPYPYDIRITNFDGYFEDLGVTYYPSLVPLVAVDTNPQPGQYTVETGTGVYGFNQADSGLQIAISYNYISTILPVYASLFNVPPIANVAPPLAVVWRDGTFHATDISTVTHFSITSNVITVTAANDFTSGQQVAIYGFSNTANQFLNGITLSVTTATATQFTATFTHANYSSVFDIGFAAVLIPGPLTISAAGSTDADNDALQYVWSENDPNLVDVFLTTNGSQAVVNVLDAAGPQDRMFDVGVAVIDLFPDFVTPRHPALNVTEVQQSAGSVTITFNAPTGAEVPITGEEIMLYDIVLGPPDAPVVTNTAGGFGFSFGAPFGEYDFSVIITYLNSVGETTGSANTLFSLPADSFMIVDSPTAAGDAESYNVYVGPVGQEVLQTFTPQLIGTNWQSTVLGYIFNNTAPPLVSTALEEFLNDQVLTLTGTTSTTLTAGFPLGFGHDFGFDFGSSSFPLTDVTGFAMSQFQFGQTGIIVPANVAPTVTFPSPAWNAGNILATNLLRNTQITITPFTITDPTTQFPVVYNGLTDPDDAPTYQWTQISGTPVAIVGHSTSPIFQFDTNGVNILGEALQFSITVSDGINPPATFTMTVNVGAYTFINMDTQQLSRSIWSATANVTSVQVTNGVATITANNTFLPGQPVFFEGMTALFLNGTQFTVLPTGFGSGFGFGFGVPTLSSTQFDIAVNVPNYGPAADVGQAFSAMPISQRNVAQSYSPLDISVIFTNLNSIKRTSILDGSDRYILISPFSVLIYGTSPSSTTPALLRKLVLPNNAAFIQDAVHCEQDYTLVLDNLGNLYRYDGGAFLVTDNPNATLVLSDFTSLSFADPELDAGVKVFTTPSFANQRVIVLSGEQGALLLQVNTTTLTVNALLEFTTASNLLYGANKVQFVRWVNVDNLRSGQVFIGTVVPKSAQITNVSIPNGSNSVIFTCANTFSVGDAIKLSSLVNASFLNGFTVDVEAATLTSFTVSLQSGGAIPVSYGPTGDTGLAESLNSGTTFETLINLPSGSIIGTWDKSKLKNQFVHTGEILFDPNSTYAGGPIPPVLAQPTAITVGGTTSVTLVWSQSRPDLIQGYNVNFTTAAVYSAAVPAGIFNPTVLVPPSFEYTGDSGVFDATTNVNLQAVSNTQPNPGQYNANSIGSYTFSPAQGGDTVNIKVQQGYQLLQSIGAGTILTVTVPLAPGSTYYFTVQATGLDGTSGVSNVASISI